MVQMNKISPLALVFLFISYAHAQYIPVLQWTYHFNVLPKAKKLFTAALSAMSSWIWRALHSGRIYVLSGTLDMKEALSYLYLNVGIEIQFWGLVIELRVERLILPENKWRVEREKRRTRLVLNKWDLIFRKLIE